MKADRIGRFRILGEMARGGMGTIFKGQDETLGRTSALKLLPPERLGKSDAVARFQREATAVARLKHPNIATLYEFVDDPEQPYLVMEWVDGTSLEERLAEGSMPLREALALLEQLLAALDYAHRQGVVHRDIKPANLICSPEGHLTVVDFGLAELFAEPEVTSTGPIQGTPLYLPPEIIAGGEADGRADLYSAALIFFEMLAGRPAFGPGTVVQIVSQQLHAPRPILSEVAPRQPVALDEVLKKAMAIKPEDRFPNGQAFLAAIQEACQVLPAGPLAASTTRFIAPAPAPPVPLSWTRRLLVGGGALLGLAFMFVGVYAVVQRLLPAAAPTPTATPLVVEIPLKKRTGPDEQWTMAGGLPSRTNELGNAFGPLKLDWQLDCSKVWSLVEGDGLLYVSHQEGLMCVNASNGAHLWATPERGVPSLARAYNPGNLLLQNPDGWSALLMMSGKPSWKESARHRETVTGVLGSNDLHLFECVGKQVIVREPMTGEEHSRISLDAPVLKVPPVASTRGLYLATKGPRLQCVDGAAEKRVWSVDPEGEPRCLALSADDVLVVGCENGNVAAFSIFSGEKVWENTNSLPSAVMGLACPESSCVAACEDGGLAAYDYRGELTWHINLGEEPAGPPLSDGTLILVGLPSGFLVCLDASTGQEKWRVELGQACTGGPISVSDWVYVPLEKGVKAFRVQPTEKS